MGAIKKVDQNQLAWDGKPARSTERERTEILAPMFAMYPNTNADGATFAGYVKMLADLDPHVLAEAVTKAINACKFLPTVADIREQVEHRAPGPRNDVDPAQLKPVPTMFFRLPDDEDKRQRLERLRQTKGWGKYYA